VPHFEFDENKSQSNRLKHGIDFFDAQALWVDINTLIISVMTEPEPDGW
jgi:uncharacterized DUF497 family protein